MGQLISEVLPHENKDSLLEQLKNFTRQNISQEHEDILHILEIIAKVFDASLIYYHKKITNNFQLCSTWSKNLDSFEKIDISNVIAEHIQRSNLHVLDGEELKSVFQNFQAKSPFQQCVGIPIGKDNRGIITIYFEHILDVSAHEYKEIAALVVEALENYENRADNTLLQSSYLSESPDAVYSVKTDGTVIYANKLAQHRLAENHQKIGDKLNSNEIEFCKECLATQKTVERINQIDGRVISTTYAPSKTLDLVFIIGRDITKQYEAQEALREREEVIRELYEITASPAYSYDEKLVALLWLGCNRLDMEFGLLNHLVGDHFVVEQVYSLNHEIVKGQELAIEETYCQDVIHTTEPISFTSVIGTPREKSPCYSNMALNSYLGISIQLKNGVYGVLNFTSKAARDLPFKSADYILIKLMAQWITNELDRKETEDEAKRLADVAKRTDNLVVITDEKGKTQWVNDAFVKATGYTLEEMKNKSPGEMLNGPESDPNTVAYMRNQLSKQQGFDAEIINYRKNGEKYWLKLEVRPLFDENKQVTNYIAIQNDITEAKRSIAILEEARKKEVEIAWRIQETLLLGKLPKGFDELQISAKTFPSKQIDGDFYEFIPLSEESIDIIVGDVMGKGIPAALLAAAVKSHIPQALYKPATAQAPANLSKPTEVLSTLLSQVGSELMKLDSFVTLCYARFDLRLKRLEYVGCGHTKSIHWRYNTKTSVFLSGNNLPLGFTDNESYEQQIVPIDTFDILVFYSDGITEARNIHGDFYGEERLVELVNQNHDLNTDLLVEKIIKDVKDFSQGLEEQGVHELDDLTCVAVKIMKLYDMEESITIRKKFPRTFESLNDIRAFVRMSCEQDTVRTWVDGDVTKLELATTEVATNIVRHSGVATENPLISIEIERSDSMILIRFFYSGDFFQPSAIKKPDLSKIVDGGLGLYIIQESVSHVQYGQDRQGRCFVELRKWRT